MAQNITIQIGQCGNQIGCRFWDLALREHSFYNQQGLYNEALSSFFQNVDTRYSPYRSLSVGTKVSTLKARALLVDMEEGVLSEILKGPIGDLFDKRQMLSDVSGSGNNWAVGHQIYGKQYHEEILDSLRSTVESCDALQSFFLIHSLGGGTGSGFGTYILELLADHYPEANLCATVVFPSSEDDVITSPYNSILSLSRLTNFADCVFPVENDALLDIVHRVDSTTKSKVKPESEITQGFSTVCGKMSAINLKKKSSGENPFNSMNNIVANLLLNMTSSSRYDGSLNVDLNEISMNLVPFPSLHYLISSMSPLYASADLKTSARKVDELFRDCFHKSHQLLNADPKHHTYLACALFGRGLPLSDIRRNIDSMKLHLRFPYWNLDGWKTGLCSVPPVGQNQSLLALANNCCISSTFVKVKDRFLRFYKRKAHLHHYLQHMDSQEFDQSLESIQNLIADYESLEESWKEPETI